MALSSTMLNLLLALAKGGDAPCDDKKHKTMLALQRRGLVRVVIVRERYQPYRYKWQLTHEGFVAARSHATRRAG